MNVTIDKSWERELREEFEKPYFKDLVNFVKVEYQTRGCFPPGRQIFYAFDSCPFDRVKVVVIGQDPYHGKGQANGLCFSVNESIPHPPSLVNIFNELKEDVGKPYPKSGDLSDWAKQGVLLLNATLSVRESEAGSHQNRGWETFTDAVISILSQRKKGIVYLLWGSFAKSKKRLIDTTDNIVLESGHPSPLSANRGLWFGNKHFSKANEYLSSKEKNPIIW